MKIVINGGGGVGQTLASVLSEEQHDVTVLEPNATRGEALQSAVDCHVVVGTGSTPADLRLAAAGESDIFLAVTNRQEVNLLSCLIARKLGCPKTIARVRHPSFRADDPAVPVSELGVDQIINPDQEAAQEIVYLLRNPGVTQIVKLANGAVAVAGITIAEGSPFDGRSLAELPDVLGEMVYRVAVIRRHVEAIVPTGRDLVEAGDEVFVIAEPETIEQIGRIAYPTADRGQKPLVMISGTSDLGRNLAGMLQKDYRVKLIETSKQAAQSASEELSQTLVIEDDRHDLGTLEREGLARTSAFVAVSDDDEMNLIGCLYAKRIGVPQTIARVERDIYRPLAMTLGVDATVSARETTVNAILKYIRPQGVQAVARMRGVSAEALEFVARAGGKIVDRPLLDIRFPRGAMVGMIVRPNEIVVPEGYTQIREGDHVVVFAVQEAVNKVQKLFA